MYKLGTYKRSSENNDGILKQCSGSVSWINTPTHVETFTSNVLICDGVQTHAIYRYYELWKTFIDRSFTLNTSAFFSELFAILGPQIVRMIISIVITFVQLFQIPGEISVEFYWYFTCNFYTDFACLYIHIRNMIYCTMQTEISYNTIYICTRLYIWR